MIWRSLLFYFLQEQSSRSPKSCRTSSGQHSCTSSLHYSRVYCTLGGSLARLMLLEIAEENLLEITGFSTPWLFIVWHFAFSFEEFVGYHAHALRRHLDSKEEGDALFNFFDGVAYIPIDLLVPMNFGGF